MSSEFLKILKTIAKDAVVSSETSYLLRNYATPDELKTIEEIVNNCKARSNGANTKLGILFEAKKKINFDIDLSKDA